MKVKLTFSEKSRFSYPPVPAVILEIEGPPKQVNDLIEAIRKRIKEEAEEKKEEWLRIWKNWEEK